MPPTSTSSPGVPTMYRVVPGCAQVRGTAGGGVGVGVAGGTTTAGGFVTTGTCSSTGGGGATKHAPPAAVEWLV